MRKDIEFRDQSRNSDRSDLSLNPGAADALGKKKKGSKQFEKLSVGIKNATEIAVRLAERRAKCKEAEQKRDAMLYMYLAALNKLRSSVSELGPEGAKVLIEQHFPGARPSFTSSEHFLLALTYPGLDAKQRAKYAATLNYVPDQKKRGGTVKSFVRKNGGINGCVKKSTKKR